MNQIIDQCHKVIRFFSKVFKKSPVEAALLLGNLLLLEKDANEAGKQHIFNAVRLIKDKLNNAETLTLWDVINKKLNSEFSILDEKTVNALNRLQLLLVYDVDFIVRLSNSKIVAYGQNVNQYRIAMIALIRRHLYVKNLPDPFVANFNYDLLQSASVEQNYLYLAGFIKQCKSLPVNALISLGQAHQLIAKLLLKDMYNTDVYFDISLSFAKLHPQLRADIALQWKQFFANYPLIKENSNKVKQVLREASIYPEFSDVNTASRVSRDHHAPQVSLEANSKDFYLKCLRYTSTMMTFPPLLYHCTRISTLTAVTLCSGGSVFPVVAAATCSAVVPVMAPLAIYGTIKWLVNDTVGPNDPDPRQDSPVSPSSNPRCALR